MLGLTILFLLGFFTLTMGFWCKVESCSKKEDLHCGESFTQNCEHTALNYCMLKKQECYRKFNNQPKFTYIVRGKCFYNKPQCQVYPDRYKDFVSKVAGNINTSFEDVSSSSNLTEDSSKPEGSV